jgi:hypothetical protein
LTDEHGKKTYNSGQLDFVECEVVSPGEDCRVTMRLLSPELVSHLLRPGLEVGVLEGLRLIGRCEVISVG